MSDITITGRVAERLQQLAEDTHQTVEELLENVLDTYAQGDADRLEPLRGSLARMAWIAMQNPIVVEETDVAERSGDILRSADYPS